MHSDAQSQHVRRSAPAQAIKRTHIRLGCRELELNESNFRFFDACRPARGRVDVLIERDAVDELGVVNGASDLLDDADITQVDIRARLRGETLDAVDGDGCED